MKSPIVVTGASGFIGQALTKALTEAGFQCVGLSRDKKAKKNDLVEVSDYADYMPPRGAVLIHLAETRDYRVVEAGGMAYVDTSIDQCQTLLGKPWKHVIYASSAAVYGDGVNTERRTDEPVVPRGAYATAKYMCERVILNAGGSALRLANVYGPGMAQNNVVSDILNQIPGGGPLLIKDGKPLRDFIWIGDVAQGFVAAAELLKDGIFNIGSGLGTSIADLARKMLTIAGEGDRPIRTTEPSRRLSCIVLDVAETKKQLGWVPSTPLSKGLKLLMR